MSITINGLHIDHRNAENQLLSLTHGEDQIVDLDSYRGISRKEAVWICKSMKNVISSIFRIELPKENVGEQHEPSGYAYETRYGDRDLAIKKLSERDSILEVGGPTVNPGYTLDDLYGVSPTYIGNVVSPDENDYTKTTYLQFDAKSLPFRSASLQAIFISCLPGALRNRYLEDQRLRDDALNEAYRVLEPNGILIWSGGTVDDLRALHGLGAMPLHIYMSVGYISLGENGRKGYVVNSPWFYGAFEK